MIADLLDVRPKVRPVPPAPGHPEPDCPGKDHRRRLIAALLTDPAVAQQVRAALERRSGAVG